MMSLHHSRTGRECSKMCPSSDHSGNVIKRTGNKHVKPMCGTTAQSKTENPCWKARPPKNPTHSRGLTKQPSGPKFLETPKLFFMTHAGWVRCTLLSETSEFRVVACHSFSASWVKTLLGILRTSLPAFLCLQTFLNEKQESASQLE